MLHPGLKLDYFHVQEWDSDWINEAKNLTRRKYEACYKKLEILDDIKEEVSLIGLHDQRLTKGAGRRRQP